MTNDGTWTLRYSWTLRPSTPRCCLRRPQHGFPQPRIEPRLSQDPRRLHHDPRPGRQPDPRPPPRLLERPAVRQTELQLANRAGPEAAVEALHQQRARRVQLIAPAVVLDE